MTFNLTLRLSELGRGGRVGKRGSTTLRACQTLLVNTGKSLPVRKQRKGLSLEAISSLKTYREGLILQ